MSNNFTLGAKTEAYYACSTVFQGETHIFGGQREYNQVKIRNKLRRIRKVSIVQQSGILWFKTY